MENTHSGNRSKSIISIGLMFIIALSIIAVICIYKMEGFQNIGEFIFFVQRKIEFIRCKMFK
ncbi:MAG: hypothetical protein JXO44_14890 [Clostridia bacterium]|nr:hypothetical protein [Clostridia bacterium]